MFVCLLYWYVGSYICMYVDRVIHCYHMLVCGYAGVFVCWQVDMLVCCDAIMWYAAILVELCVGMLLCRYAGMLISLTRWYADMLA